MENLSAAGYNLLLDIPSFAGGKREGDEDSVHITVLPLPLL